MKKVNYIHCIKCNGVIGIPVEEPINVSNFIALRGDQPRCKECGTAYEINIYTKGIMKIEIEEIH